MADESNASFIGGYARTVREMFTGRKYGLEYYQREYTWSETNISELLDDLTTAFLDRYDEIDDRRAVASYPPYFLGPVVTSRAGSMRYLVDGQQRLTTLTLLLIHLHQLADGRDDAENLASLVFSQQFGKTAFNIDADEREPVMTAILNKTAFDPRSANEACATIWARFNDVSTLFPAELSGTALLHFTDWLLERVVLVEIETTDHNMALTMFETMNDRGQRLSNTDMLKSFLIARVGDNADIDKASRHAVPRDRLCHDHVDLRPGGRRQEGGPDAWGGRVAPGAPLL